MCKISGIMLLVVLLCACAQFGCTQSEFYSFSNLSATPGQGGDGMLYKVDPSTATDTAAVLDLSANPVRLFITSLTFEPSNWNVLLGYDGSTTELVSIDLSTTPPQFAYKSTPCPQNFPGLRYCPQDGKLYGIDPNVDKLFEVTDVSSCTVREIGPLGVDFDNTDLACHPTTDVLYTFNSNDGIVYKLDKTTGAATLVLDASSVVTAPRDIVALDFDPVPVIQQTPPAVILKLYLFSNDRSYEMDMDNAGNLGQATFKGNLPHLWRHQLAARKVSNG